MSQAVKKISLSFFLITTIMTVFAFSRPILAAQKPAEQGYILLEPTIIGGEAGATTPVKFLEYVRGIFTTIFIVVVMLVILMLVIGGFEYMFSSIPGSKSEGKDRIKAAIGGLLIALAAYLILNTINPDILSVEGTLFNALNPNQSQPSQ